MRVSQSISSKIIEQNLLPHICSKQHNIQFMKMCQKKQILLSCLCSVYVASCSPKNEKLHWSSYIFFSSNCGYWVSVELNPMVEQQPIEMVFHFSPPRQPTTKTHKLDSSHLATVLVLILTFVPFCVCSWLGWWLPGLPWHNGWSHLLVAALASLVCKYEEEVPLSQAHAPECFACLQLTLLDFLESSV